MKNKWSKENFVIKFSFEKKIISARLCLWIFSVSAPSIFFQSWPILDACFQLLYQRRQYCDGTDNIVPCLFASNGSCLNNLSPLLFDNGHSNRMLLHFNGTKQFINNPNIHVEINFNPFACSRRVPCCGKHEIESSWYETQIFNYSAKESRTIPSPVNALVNCAVS